jgi:hypothetical protein
MTGAEAVGVGLGFLAIVAPEFWPKMPRALSYTLAGIGLSWLTYSFILGIESLSHTKLQYGPLGIIILGAILIAVGLFWHISHIGSGESADNPHPRATESPAPKNDPAILIECHYGIMPTTPERVYALNLFPTPIENGGGGLVEYFSFDEKKGERIWPKSKDGFPLSAFKCQLTNYDAATLFGVKINMQLQFLETVRDGNNVHSGKATLAREWPIFITKIDPGASNAFVFYTFNMTDRFVGVTFPESGSASQLQDQEPKKVRLIQPFKGFEMSFVPFDPAPPDAAAAPRK